MTPQQANELCPHCGKVPRHLERNPGLYEEAIVCDTCRYSLPPEVWNRRAPAPTSEPGARDAVRYQLLRNSPDGIEFRDANGVWRADCPSGAKLDAILDLATPASPAVPNFCANCGKRLAPGSIHTCTPPADPAPLVAQASPAHECIVREGDTLTCTACGTSSSAAELGLLAIDAPHGDFTVLAEASPLVEDAQRIVAKGGV